MPAIFITYSLAYLDRANYGFGAAAGLAKTLNISGSQTAILGSLFFLGYFIFQIPGAMYARRHSAARLIFIALVAWGSLAALTGVIRNFWLLVLDRFVLGIAESLIMPAALLLLTNWFTRQERSRANTFLILGNPVTVLWMSAITGYLIHSFGWQKTFIIEGIPSVLWAFVWLVLVRDHPHQAKWLSAEASADLAHQLALEQRSLPPIANLGLALRRPDVLIFCAMYFCWSIGMYAFVLWLPTIIQQGLSKGIEATGLLSAAPYVLGVIAMIVTSQISDRTQRRGSLVWPSMLFAGFALLISSFLAAHSFWLAYIGLILTAGGLYAPYGPFFAMIPEIIPANVAAGVIAAVNSAGALGGFFGTWLVGELQARTGGSKAGLLFMSFSTILSGLLMLCIKRTSPNSSESAGPYDLSQAEPT
ncbi:MFS transporter [Granulicella sp. WH15]|nr:MFS transporter [Granulicella sp. WH15]